MEYFLLKPKVLRNRKYPQSESWIGRYDYESENSIQKINHFKPIDFEIEVPDFELHEKSEWTDNVSCIQFMGFSTLMVSQKLAELLEELSPDKWQFYNLNLTKKSESRVYKMAYLSRVQNEMIDFSKSTFFYAEGSYENTSVSLVKFSNSSEYNRELLRITNSKANKRLHYHEISLVNDRTEDVFRLYNLVNNIVVSENFKSECEKRNISGFEMVSFDTVAQNYHFKFDQYQVENIS